MRKLRVCETRFLHGLHHYPNLKDALFDNSLYYSDQHLK